MALQAVSARSARLLAAVCVTALSVLTVGAASARAAESSLTLSYTCTFPLIGSHSVSVTYGEDLPGSVTQGVLASSAGTTAAIAVPAIAAEGLTLVGAATVSGSAAGDESVTDGAASFGGPVTYTVSETPIPASGAFTIDATGTFPSVTFPNAGTADLTAGNLSLTLTPLDSKGQPTALGTFTSACTPRPGQDNVLGTFQVLDPAASKTALTASPNPSLTGTPVTLMAKVSGKSSTSGVPTGRVTFSAGGTPLYTQTLAHGTATVVTGRGGVPALAAGSHVITAVYHGDKRFAGSTSNMVTEVVKTATTTAVTSSANPSVQGQTVTYTAKVSPAGGGSVTFADGGKPVTGCKARSLNSSGQATCQVTYATTGSHAVTAAYSGDAANAGSTSAVLTQSVVVDRADLSVRLSVPAKAATGAIVTEKVTVTNMGPATATTEVTALSEPPGLAVINADGALVRGPLLTWSRPSLAPGASRTFTVTVQVGSHASGMMQVVAGAVSVTQDPDLLNNIALGEISLG
jgi:Bacterial Ig-like domain (group 3)/Domain of unknown function DUF11